MLCIAIGSNPIAAIFLKCEAFYKLLPKIKQVLFTCFSHFFFYFIDKNPIWRIAKFCNTNFLSHFCLAHFFYVAILSINNNFDQNKNIHIFHGKLNYLPKKQIYISLCFFYLFIFRQCKKNFYLKELLLLNFHSSSFAAACLFYFVRWTAHSVV